jgi:membrane-associated phospholipid phosphatase
MLRYNARLSTALSLCISLVFVVPGSGQEHLKADSLRSIPAYNSVAESMQSTPKIHYNDSLRIVRDIKTENLIVNISSIPGDIITTGKNFFSQKNIPMLGLMAGSTASIYSQDQRLYVVTQRLQTRSGRFRRFATYGVAFGDGKWQLAGAAAMALYGYATSDNRLVKTSFEITEAIVSTGIAIQLLKHSIGRESPGSYTKAGGRFHPFPSVKEYNKNQAHYYSFPSGHTATAVTALTVISENYPEVYWIKPAGYCAVACLGTSLVSKNMHWYSDLPLAAMIGYSFGKTVTGRTIVDDAALKANERSIDVSVLPNVYYKSAGMSLLVSF